MTDVPTSAAPPARASRRRKAGQLSTDSAKVSVQSDATIALPLLASALANTAPPILARRKPPVFTLASRVMTIDGQTVPHDRFEEVNESPV